MSDDQPRRCAQCRKQPVIEGHAVCALCLANLPVRKPIADTLALIDATLAGVDLPRETP